MDENGSQRWPRGRNVSPAERREWLRLRDEEGESEEAIARRFRRTERTVRDQIGRAREERERHQARVARLKQLLDDHQGDLLRALALIGGETYLQPFDQLVPLGVFPETTTTTVYVPVGEELERRTKSVEVDGSENAETEWDLLRQLALQHLRTSQRQLAERRDKWWIKHDEYANACFRLGRVCAAKVKEKTGLDPAPQGTGTDGFHEMYVVWLCRYVFSEIEGDARPPLKMRIVENQLQVVGGTAVARSASEGTLESARDAFPGLVEELLEFEIREPRLIVNHGPLLRENAEQLRRDFMLLKLRRHVSGRCEVCKGW